MPTYQELIQQRDSLTRSRPSLDLEETRLQNEMGLPQRQTVLNDIRKNIASTDRILQDTPRDVMQRSRRLGGPVTSSVLNRLTSARQDPLISQLGNMSRTEGVEQSGIRDTNESIARKLALMQGERMTQDSNLNRLVDQAFGAEQAQKDRDFQAQQQSLAMATQRQIAAQQAAAQQRLAEYQQSLYGKLYGGGSTTTKPGPTVTLATKARGNASAVPSQTQGDLADFFSGQYGRSAIATPIIDFYKNNPLSQGLRGLLGIK
jgi:hypothetical protein